MGYATSLLKTIFLGNKWIIKEKHTWNDLVCINISNWLVKPLSMNKYPLRMTIYPLMSFN